jgi:hypothetical protein
LSPFAVKSFGSGDHFARFLQRCAAFSNAHPCFADFLSFDARSRTRATFGSTFASLHRSASDTRLLDSFAFCGSLAFAAALTAGFDPFGFAAAGFGVGDVAAGVIVFVSVMSTFSVRTIAKV